MNIVEYDFDPYNYQAIGVLELLGIECPTQNQIDILERLIRENAIDGHLDSIHSTY